MARGRGGGAHWARRCGRASYLVDRGRSWSRSRTSLRRVAQICGTVDSKHKQAPAPLTSNHHQPLHPFLSQTWGGGLDSYFEYLIEYARLTNNADKTFVNAWKLAVDSSIRTLKKKSTVGNYTYIADYDGSQIVHVGSHLECFHAGNWLLGGKLLNNNTIVQTALEMNEACWNTYAGTPTGIGPEAFAFISADGNYTGSSISAAQLQFYQKHGYYITDADYIERPEVLESNFYAWRVTGSTKYLDRAASAVASFDKYLKVSDGGCTDISDVTSANSARYDETESFWFAEVLKYLYLTFNDPKHISLDEWGFNTEAHPFKAPAALSQYWARELSLDSVISVE